MNTSTVSARQPLARVMRVDMSDGSTAYDVQVLDAEGSIIARIGAADRYTAHEICDAICRATWVEIERQSVRDKARARAAEDALRDIANTSDDCITRDKARAALAKAGA